MIDVSEIMDDPELAQSFTVDRSVGHFSNGRWVPDAPQTLSLVGVIMPAKKEDALQILPEGSRLDNLIVCYCATEIHVDNAEDAQSDVIYWHGKPYRAIRARVWGDAGYWEIYAEGFIP